MTSSQRRGDHYSQGSYRDRLNHNPASSGNQRLLGGPGSQRQLAMVQGHFQQAHHCIPPAQVLFPPQSGVSHFQPFWHQSAENFSPMYAVGEGEEPAMPARWHAPTNLQAFELFETMLMCGVETGWKKYLAIYWLHFQNGERDISLRSPMFENDRSLHAERVLVDHLQTQLSVSHTERLKAITIMQNASPCARCADGYRDDLQSLLSSGIKISVVFSSFHWIKRFSCTCREKNHPHRQVSFTSHTANVRALRELSNAGFTVRTTCYGDWEQLCIGLRIPFPRHLHSRDEYSYSRRGREDANLKKDLDDIFGASQS